jgi:hypothetical protein
MIYEDIYVLQGYCLVGGLTGLLSCWVGWAGGAGVVRVGRLDGAP